MNTSFSRLGIVRVLLGTYAFQIISEGHLKKNMKSDQNIELHFQDWRFQYIFRKDCLYIETML